MQDFLGKKIKVFLNTHYGHLCMTGMFIKLENGFLVILDEISSRVEYISMYNIKNVEIVG